MKKCPYCDERIRDKAVVCRYCGRDLPPDTAAPPAEKKRTRVPKGIRVILWMAAGFSGLCLTSFITYKFAYDWWPIFVSPLTGHILYFDRVFDEFDLPDNSSNPWDIYMIHANGSGLQSLSRDRCIDSQDPTYSPDGRKIAFISYNCGELGGGLFVMDRDGTNLKNIAGSIYAGNYYDWSPDGSKIVFEKSNLDNYHGGEIWMASVDGTTPERSLLSAEVGSNLYPQWSPDGKKIAFVISSENSIMNVFTMDENGSDFIRLSLNSEPGQITHPTWSPDGTKIAFLKFEDGPEHIGDLVVMDADGANPRGLVSGDVGEYTPPIWSPDGSRILYEKYKQLEQENLYIANLDGTQETTQSLCRDCYITAQAWSPDGKWILYKEVVKSYSEFTMARNIHYRIKLYSLKAERSKTLVSLKMRGFPSYAMYQPGWIP